MHHPEGCVRYAALLLTGSPGDKDIQQAQTALKTACDLKSWTGCFKLGELREKGVGEPARDLPDAFRLYVKACDVLPGETPFKPACAKSAQFYASGTLVKEERTRVAFGLPAAWRGALQ